jgi:hypothetical protein
MEQAAFFLFAISKRKAAAFFTNLKSVSEGQSLYFNSLTIPQ